MQRIPYSPDELNYTETYPSPHPFIPPAPKYNKPIAPKENYKTLMTKETPLWMPSGSDTAMASVSFLPEFIAHDDPNGGADFFGIVWENVDMVGGAIVRPGQPRLEDANDWEKEIKFPDLSIYDWEKGKDVFDPNETRARSLNLLCSFFERLISFMDYGPASIAIIDEDQVDAVKALFWKLSDFYKELVDYYIKYVGVDAICYFDDWGHQHDSALPPDAIMDVIVPPIKSLNDYLHSKGIVAEQHSCGSNAKIVECIIATGADFWQGQAEINDKHAYYEKYGDRFIFGVEPEPLGPDATADEIYQTAENFVNEYCNPDKGVSFFSSMGANQKLVEAVYELSRKKLS